MMAKRFAMRFCTVLFLGLGVYSASAFAQNDSGDSAKQYAEARPVYIDVHPIADSDVIFSDGLIAAMAKEKLSSEGVSAIRMRPDSERESLPNSVRVLRVIWVMHVQKTAKGVVMAASAAVDLLRTASDRHDTILATSIYSGVHQSLVQGNNEKKARDKLRKAFREQLHDRIDTAFKQASAAQ